MRLPLLRLCLFAIGSFLRASSVSGQTAIVENSGTGTNTKRPPMPKGISAWSYVFEEKSVAHVRDYNSAARPDQQFRYFFPYAGSMDFNATKREAKLYYHPGRTSDPYAKALPPGTLIMPVIDARADKREFHDWTDSQYRTAAFSVAEAIAADRHAAGVQVDIEPFAESHLPFYRHLRRELNARGKYTTMFVGPKNERLLTAIFESCDIVIISGYDMDAENPGVEKYRKQLTSAVARVQKVAAATEGKFMIGIPAAASSCEYEYMVEAGGLNRTETGHRQEDYVRAALDVLRSHQESSEFLGLALWKLSGAKEADEPEKATRRTRFPDYIRPSVWQILTEQSAR